MIALLYQKRKQNFNIFFVLTAQYSMFYGDGKRKAVNRPTHTKTRKAQHKAPIDADGKCDWHYRPSKCTNKKALVVDDLRIHNILKSLESARKIKAFEAEKISRK